MSRRNVARESVKQLAALEPAVVAPGHGRPLSGALLPNELLKLAARLDVVAVAGQSQGVGGVATGILRNQVTRKFRTGLPRPLVVILRNRKLNSIAQLLRSAEG